MDLSVREAAALMGRSPRTVRGQLARGDLPGRKRNGRWQVDRRHLPLNEDQRAALCGKAQRIRRAVETALPSRLAPTADHRYRSIADLDAFRRGTEILTEIRQATDDVVPAAVREPVEQLVDEGLLALAEAVQQFDREVKLEALKRTRAALARAVARLLVGCGIPPAEPARSWVVALEAEVVPAVAGFARWADNLGRSRR